MLERGILRGHVRKVILRGERIEEDATSDPYPSALLRGVVGERPLHVALARDRSAAGLVYIVTPYEPDEEHFEFDLKTRRKNADDEVD
jgi:hypothetical protein